MDDKLLALFNHPAASDSPTEREIRGLISQAHAAEARGASAEMIWPKARALVAAEARRRITRSKANYEMATLKATLAAIWERYPDVETVAELVRLAPEASALSQRPGSTRALLGVLEQNTHAQITRDPARMAG
jgi:hypothetical protein